MITSPDDGMVRSHEEAAALLRGAVPGARVEIRRPHLRRWNQRNSEADRAYTITAECLPRWDAVVLGSYSLPANAEQLAKAARDEMQRRVPR